MAILNESITDKRSQTPELIPDSQAQNTGKILHAEFQENSPD